MEKIKRSERMAVILLTLAQHPNRLFSLSQLAEQFGCAKSTLSEDMSKLRQALLSSNMGTLETVPGAAGGICYLPFRSAKENLRIVDKICQAMQDASRIMPGGFLYTVDLFSDPDTVSILGKILAQKCYPLNPDVVVTIESKGVPIGLMLARALGKRLVIARKENRATEGSVVTLNYLSTSSKLLSAMSLPRRALKPGQRVLLVDDFVKGGGTMRGLREMMREFSCEVVGECALIRKISPGSASVCSLLELQDVDTEEKKINLQSAQWLIDAAKTEKEL